MASTIRSETLAMMGYIDASPSPYHAVTEAGARLVAGGFRALDLEDPWPTGPGGYVVERDGSLVAWWAPDGAPSDAPFRVVGAHTDSPNLRLKPHPDTGRAGFRQLAVEVYGGALLNSWLDRDLGLSGRVTVRAEGGGVAHHLVLVDKALARVPQLAIHLDRDISSKGLLLNPQQHLVPIWGVGAVDEGGLVRFVADELGIDAGEILGWELMLHDLTPASFLGASGELLASARLDNLCSCFAAVRALLDVAQAVDSPNPAPRWMAGAGPTAICLYDHEEVGSESATGAGGTLLASVLERAVAARGGDRDAFLRSMAGSVCASADMAHATHPNYSERHEPGHWIEANGGPVIKVNANQRYATDGRTSAEFALACERAEVPVQRFVSRTDLPCGSTIGPITSARLGMRTVDVGVAQLSMHSARELCGADDPARFVHALRAFLTPPRPR